MIQLDIVQEKEMPLLERKRVTANLSFNGATPSKAELRKDIAKKLKVDEKLVAIRHVYQKFGSSNAKLIVHVYKDFDALCSLEKDGKNIKADLKKVEEAKKAAEEAKKAKEVKEETPAEEKPIKEEPKGEQ
ncbi:MAG: hypothetical protein KKA65_01940 [Nanoarchaeota archaeon]|nr:hypothetical protein [Nanoarchaeota archaeon]MBU4241953.1 hypothetical protein [Nanoarchaeota archaeon]MBU4352204.1 hypothetical protein [Nanoarchaeota archaeon]MBU4456238.1 hypothetical protein [Nanoarchaeota archaeon]MCG2719374.1 hypothetical protein [Nanoarchaeota archaeon]